MFGVLKPAELAGTLIGREPASDENEPEGNTS